MGLYINYFNFWDFSSIKSLVGDLKLIFPNQYVQKLVTLPDANKLPDEKTLGIGTQSLTLAEKDYHLRMNEDHPSARVQE